MAPKERLEQVKAHLSSKPHGARFRPKLPKGLPVHYTPLNPLAFLLKAASIRPQHLAIDHPERGYSFSYEQWAGRVAQLAYALKAKGIKPGDRVLVCAPNTPMIMDALQAIPAVQGVIVAINIRLTAPEVMYQIEDSGSKLALVDSQFKHLFKDAKIPVVICEDSHDASDPYEKFLQEGAEHDRKSGGLEWDGLEFQPNEMATFAISYTSGTTSKPKGVETVYRGTYLAALANAHEARLAHDSNYLWILPAFHCLGWTFPFAITASMCTQTCSRGVGDYTEIWKGFLERGVTHYCGAPTVQLSIISHPMAKKLNRVVRTTVAGAAPTATLIKGLEAININVVHVYGLSETYGPSTRTYFVPKESANYYDMMARQGYAFLTADDIRVVKQIDDDDALNIREGDLVETAFDGEEVGEIIMRGNIVMKGYLNKAEATKKAFAGSWFHTGDLAVRYPDGTFAIRDRSKDLIISGGENVSSLFVESELTKHEDVLEVAVVAAKHEKWGERPHAFVVLRNPPKWEGKVEDFATSLKAFVKGKMPGFAIPEWVEVVPELQKTSTGKIQKNVLRDMLKSRSQ